MIFFVPRVLSGPDVPSQFYELVSYPAAMLTPLLKKRQLSALRAALYSVILPHFAGAVLLSFTLRSREYSELSTNPSAEQEGILQHTIHRPPRHEILYQDWRGLSQEEEDTFTFVHSWSGSLLIGEKEEEHIDPKSLKIEFVDEKVGGSDAVTASGIKGPSSGGETGEFSSPARWSEIKSKLEKRYKVFLVGDAWTESQASALLAEHEDLCGLGLLEAQSPISCELDKKLNWVLKLEPIGDDIQIEGDTASVSVTGSLPTLHPTFHLQHPQIPRFRHLIPCGTIQLANRRAATSSSRPPR